MTADELLAAYPRITHAVSLVELIICQSNDGEQTSWDIMMSAVPPLSPNEVIEMIQSVVREEIDEGAPGRNREALAEMSDPQFRTYIAGKMGLA